MEPLISEITSDEICEAAALVKNEFERYVAPDFLPQGIEEFLNFIQPEAFFNRLNSGNFAYGARSGSRLIGFIEIHNHSHICLLFVDENFHGRGIAKKLLQVALSKCREFDGELNRITVNASLFAVKIYEKMGFKHIESEQVKNGMRFIPMEKKLRDIP